MYGNHRQPHFKHCVFQIILKHTCVLKVKSACALPKSYMQWSCNCSAHKNQEAQFDLVDDNDGPIVNGTFL